MLYEFSYTTSTGSTGTAMFRGTIVADANGNYGTVEAATVEAREWVGEGGSVELIGSRSES